MKKTEEIDLEREADIRLFNQLFTDYRRRFIRFADTYVGDRSAAEDIVTDSLMYYWENRMELSHVVNLPAYLLSIVKHQCLNYLQRARKQEEIVSYLKDCEAWELDLRICTLEACDPERLFSEELQLLVERALSTLPEQTREIFIRSRYENQSHKEIATVLGLSTKSVEYHITKALKLLRVALKDYLPVWLIDWLLMGAVN